MGNDQSTLLVPKTVPSSWNIDGNCKNSICRDGHHAVQLEGDMPITQDAIKANEMGYSYIVSNCFSDKDKINNFKNIMKPLEKYGWSYIGSRTEGIGSVCWWTHEKPSRLVYEKKQSDEFNKECCNTYTKNSPQQKIYCDLCTCVENKNLVSKCGSGLIIKSCLSYFEEDTETRYNSIKNKITDSFDENNVKHPKYTMYKEIINGLLTVLNSPECNEQYIKENISMILNSDLIKFVDLFIELLNDPEIQKSEMKINDLVSLLSSNLIKNLVKAQDPTNGEFNNKFKNFCNNDDIFDGTDWDKKVELYGKVCSCFWDPTKNNGNPSNLQKNKIEKLKSKEGLPDELKEYAQFASDIEPSGPTYCWDSQCINNDNNLIPNRDDCPSTNIASCLAYINFDNKGLIKGNISNLVGCVATIDNEKQKETLEKLIEKYREEFGNDGSSGPGSDTSNGSGTKPKKKKNNTTIWIIVGVVAVVLLIIIIIAIAIALSRSSTPQQAPIAYS